jgi:hypothetical protein
MRGPHDRIEHATRARPDGSFAPALDGRDPREDAALDVQVVWHHDAAEYMPMEPKPADIWSRWKFSATAPSEEESQVVVPAPRHHHQIDHRSELWFD